MRARTTKPITEYDASDLIGLNVVIHNAATEITEDDGEVWIEVPDIETASAAAAVARCMMPVRILPSEMRVMRRIAEMTAADLAHSMDPKTSPETISRWENDRQPMGGYAEKVFRLVICERLKNRAPGVDYTDGAIAKLIVLDPWRNDPEYQVPSIVMERVRVRSEHKETVCSWATEMDKVA